MKKTWRVGDSGWEVEWCYELAFYDDDPGGDVDRDRCKERRRWFRVEEEARKYAREVAYPQAVGTFGTVAVTPFVLEYLVPEERLGTHVEYTADSEYYEGDQP